MTIRRLKDQHDFFDCVEIIKQKKKMGGTTPPNIEAIMLSYEKYFRQISADNFQAYGYIENDKIISFILLAYIENKARGKFWIMPAIYTAKTYNLFSFNKPEIGLLIKHAFEYAELSGYYEYYYAIAQHVSEVYERQINKTEYIPLYRYDRIDLAMVPKGTISDVDLYAKLLGDPKPHNMVIKKRILKQEFRLNKMIED